MREDNAVEQGRKNDASLSDEAAVRDLYQRLMDGWNDGSGEAFASVFTEDGRQVAFDGTLFLSREEIATSHQELFDKWLKGTRLVGRVKEVRFLASDVALMHAAGGTIMRGKSEPASERESIQTMVAVRRDGEWKLAALDNVRIRSMSRGFGAFVFWAISDRMWKVFGGRRGV